MRVCEEFSKIQDPELIHPSDKKYNKALEKRQRRDREETEKRQEKWWFY